MVCNANGLCPHKAQISNELNSSAVSNLEKFVCHGYIFEEFHDAFGVHQFTDRANSLGTGIIFYYMGGLSSICLLAKNCCYQISKFELNLFELDLIFLHAI